jgi:mannose-6-phosphate isomerase-like protein (cupin superfamily)
MPLFRATHPARAVGLCITFEPGARTAWHTHPLGQTLIVTSGSGLAQRLGGPIEEIHSGDVVWFPLARIFHEKMFNNLLHCIYIFIIIRLAETHLF